MLFASSRSLPLGMMTRRRIRQWPAGFGSFFDRLAAPAGDDEPGHGTPLLNAAADMSLIPTCNIASMICCWRFTRRPFDRMFRRRSLMPARMP